jgi:serine/threonine protein phosphatase PrpC
MIRKDQAHFQVVARSHPGRVRTNNEDRFAVSAFRVSSLNPTPAVFAVLCDGIGGHRAGEVAAEMAVNLISQRVAESDASQPQTILQTTLTATSQTILEHAQGDAGQKGMGATCVCAWVIGSRLYTASVGDSRLYLLSGHAIHQISTDHTWVQEALELGIITPEQAQGHRNSHIIRRYLGSLNPPQVDFRLRLNDNEAEESTLSNQGLALLPGDMVLLCSDGLTDLVSAAEIQSALRSQPLEAAAQALIDLALQRGGHDNITLVILKNPVAADSKTRPIRKLSLRRWVVGCLGALLVMILAGFLALTAAGLMGVPLPIDLPWLPPAAASTITPPVLPATATFVPPQVQPSPTPTVTPTHTGRPAPNQPGGPSLTPWPTHTLPAVTLMPTNNSH